MPVEVKSSKETRTVVPEEGRLLVTFALFAYNQEQFIREAVEGAFSQTYSSLEIILSDDCSQDKTFDIMKEMVAAYEGPHKIILNRNESNLGIGGHVNKIFGMSSGELIVMAAGDDISLPERTEYVAKAWEENNYPYVVFTGWWKIAVNGGINVNSEYSQYLGGNNVLIENGGFDSILAYLHGKPFGRHGATAAYSKSLYKAFGPLNNNVLLEDYALFLRSLLLGCVLILKEPLVRYRTHEESISSIKGSGPERFRKWSLLYAPVIDSFCDDIIYAKKNKLIANKKDNELLKVARSWSKCAPYMEQWFVVGMLKRIFILFPAVFLMGSRRHKKFALRNVFVKKSTKTKRNERLV